MLRSRGRAIPLRFCRTRVVSSAKWLLLSIKPAVSGQEFSAIDPDALPDMLLALQPGLHYLNASWPVDELMKLYLTETAPDRLELSPAKVWIEVRGARGEFHLSRLDAAEYIFRKSVLEGHSIGAAADVRSRSQTPVSIQEKLWRGLLPAGLITTIKHDMRPNETPSHRVACPWFISARDLLGRFPLSILQLGMRVGVGMVFFKAGLLKYQSFEFAVKLFEDEYKLPFLAPAVAARMAMINELTTSTLLFLGLATRLITLPLFGMISVIQIFVYPSAWPDHVLWGSILVFLLTRGPGIPLNRLSHRTVSSETNLSLLQPIPACARMAWPFSAFNCATRHAHRCRTGVFQRGSTEIQVIRLRDTAVRAGIQGSARRSGRCSAHGDGQ